MPNEAFRTPTIRDFKIRKSFVKKFNIALIKNEYSIYSFYFWNACYIGSTIFSLKMIQEGNGGIQSEAVNEDI